MGPGLRTGHFATALVRAGHDVLTVAVGTDERAGPHDGSVAIEGSVAQTVDVSERDFGGSALGAIVGDFAPDALVGVTAMGASLASRLEPDVPLWADVFGDLMAEAQAKALVHASDSSLVHFWSLLQPVLDRADRFSAVSRAQADALIGQLGLAGRLGAANAGEHLVSVIPCAAEYSDDHDADDSDICADVPNDAFVVLWTGSFNTWCDVDTLARGLDAAMARDRRIYFACSGGPVPGHDEATWRAFVRHVHATEHAARYRLLGWVEPATLEAWYRRADVGIVVERDLYERRFGSENRVVQWMARGLPCLTTARSELGRCLVARELAFGCRPGDPTSLAEALVALAVDGSRAHLVGRSARAFCEENLGYTQTAAPLLEWCASPVHARDFGVERPLTVGLLSEPAAAVHLLEAYLANLHVGQVAFRSARWLGRRLARGWRARRLQHAANRRDG
jgi:hypothetical protein